MKKRIYDNVFNKYSKISSNDDFSKPDLIESIALNPQWFNPKNFSIILCIILLLSSLFTRVAIIAFLSFTIFLLYNYFSLKMVAQNLKIKRKNQPHGIEHCDTPVIYQIENPTYFNIYNLVIIDFFEGNSDDSHEVSLPKVKAGKRIKLNRDYLLNNGMGVKNFNEMVAKLADPIGLFQFTIIFEYDQFIEVYPNIEEKDHDWSRANEDAIRHGVFEVPKKGDSINFTGIREYREGDPLKYINWLISARTDDLYINEFNKIVDSNVIVAINNLDRAQLSDGAISTFEYAKDLGLLVASDQLKKSNELTLVTSDKIYPMGTGESQVQVIERILSSLEETDTSNNKIFNFLSSEFSRQATIIYITPLYHDEEFLKMLNLLRNLSIEDRKVILITLDASAHLIKEAEGDLKIMANSLEGIFKSILRVIHERVGNSKLFHFNFKVDENPGFTDVRDDFMKRHQKHRNIYE